MSLTLRNGIFWTIYRRVHVGFLAHRILVICYYTTTNLGEEDVSTWWESPIRLFKKFAVPLSNAFVNTLGPRVNLDPELPHSLHLVKVFAEGYIRTTCTKLESVV